MNTVRLQGSRNNAILDSFYHDAFIHTEDKKIFNAHRVLLAVHSPFLHEYFQSRPGHDVKDVYFHSTNSNLVKIALDLLYNGEVNVETKYLKRFRWFVETLLKIKLQLDTVPKISPNSLNSFEHDAREIASRPSHSALSQSSSSCPSDNNNPAATEIPINYVSDKVVGSNPPPPPAAKILTSCTIDTPSSPESNITERHETKVLNESDGIPPSSAEFPDNWTLTSVCTKELLEIHHLVNNSQEGRRYKCEICQYITKTFDNANNHYVGKHQNVQYERETLETANKVRRICLEKIENIKNEMNAGSNVTMAANRLKIISVEFTKQASLLDNFDKTKVLPPTLNRKRKQMLLLLYDNIRSLEYFIEQKESTQ